MKKNHDFAVGLYFECIRFTGKKRGPLQCSKYVKLNFAGIPYV